ncbi:hypothetical protein Lal_00026378 [Lupinus albus]|uniref:Putative SKP1/BTB/POZ domain, NPH3 domain-containing protein n=1 Tax=Lupinus albus TaxID=3870 RepID=A0A6A5LMF6_LUPAL|nr:putative SKP1/BTB/POZ domain, NPH3 domain-containing protein [Lupinus albus]KAF1861899.1 hypothetical protein Lal_00026378 [Lupinus albus]
MATWENQSSNSKGQAWFCTTGLPSDIVVEVDDMNFHLHKFPLMSKSQKLHQLIKEKETMSIPEEDQIVEQNYHLKFFDFPGSSETFELAAKFSYGVKIDLSAANVAFLRCAGEYLEMTEEYSEDNLISKTEKFLSQFVFKSIKHSIITLKSCQHLMPLADSLGITHRCIDSIVTRASSLNPALFGWPVSDTTGRTTRRKGGLVAHSGECSFEFEEISFLGLPLFKQLLLAMRGAELNTELIENCLMHYANKHILGLSRSNRKPLTSSFSSEAHQKELLQCVISNLPLEKNSKPLTIFLFGLLRTSHILNASEECRDALEKKIGSQLHEATLDDLLIPSYSYLNETLYDVDCVERILGHFLRSFEEENVSVIGAKSAALILVGKLIDGYLSEIASDANLKPGKFYNLAISLPDQARLFDDSLYRAVDIYFKAHPRVSEAEREKICGVLDFEKLTLEACTHAAQNERLPLRAVVQVLFFEQIQLRHAIAGTITAATTREEGDTWQVTVRDNQVLRFDMDSMRTRVHQLERECSSMKSVIEKMDEPGPQGGGGGWWASMGLGRKFGCKFKTQVCNSHEPVVVDMRKGRPNHLQHHRSHPE